MAAKRCFQKVLEMEPSNREAQQEVRSALNANMETWRVNHATQTMNFKLLFLEQECCNSAGVRADGRLRLRKAGFQKGTSHQSCSLFFRKASSLSVWHKLNLANSHTTGKSDSEAESGFVKVKCRVSDVWICSARWCSAWTGPWPWHPPATASRSSRPSVWPCWGATPKPSLSPGMEELS